MIITIPLRKANPIGRLTARNNNLLDPQFTRSLNHIVCTQHISLKALVIRYEHVPRIRGEMYDGIDGAHGYCFRVTRIRVVIDVEIGCKGIEDLAGVCQVCFEGVDRGVRKRDQVQVEDGVAFGQEIRYYVAARFS